MMIRVYQIKLDVSVRTTPQLVILVTSKREKKFEARGEYGNA